MTNILCTTIFSIKLLVLRLEKLASTGEIKEMSYKKYSAIRNIETYITKSAEIYPISHATGLSCGVKHLRFSSPNHTSCRYYVPSCQSRHSRVCWLPNLLSKPSSLSHNDFDISSNLEESHTYFKTQGRVFSNKGRMMQLGKPKQYWIKTIYGSSRSVWSFRVNFYCLYYLSFKSSCFL